MLAGMAGEKVDPIPIIKAQIELSTLPLVRKRPDTDPWAGKILGVDQTVPQSFKAFRKRALSGPQAPFLKLCGPRPAIYTPNLAAFLPAATTPIIATTRAATAARTKSTAARRLRPRLVYVHGAAVQICAIQRGNCCFRLLAVRHFNKCEPPRLSAVPIGNEINSIDLPKLGKRGFNLCLCGTETEVSDKDIHASLRFLWSESLPNDAPIDQGGI
jgi:hypothetical protein